MTNQDELALAHNGAWTDDEIKRLKNMVASGFSNELIAKALGRKLQAVATRVHYLKKRRANETANARKKWTQAEVVVLETMLQKNATIKDIGAALQRTPAAVREYLRRLRNGEVTPAVKEPQQIFSAPMPPEIKPITLTPEQRAWSKPEPQTHRNAAWAAVAVAVGLAGFILGGLAQ
jgi:hypothetical protein